MGEGKCPFYETDTEAEKKAAELENALKEILGEKEWQRQKEMAGLLAEQLPEEPYDGCYGCRHFYDGPGYPGETVYACRRPGDEHIIHTDISLWEII